MTDSPPIAESASTVPDRYRIVLAEDDDGLRETVAEILSVAFDVTLAVSGEEAIERMSDQDADLALFDLQMGAVSGLDVVRIIRVEYELQTPCLLMTARPDDSVREEARRLGVADLLEKPFARIRLVDSVAAAMRDAYGELDAADWFAGRRN